MIWREATHKGSHGASMKPHQPAGQERTKLRETQEPAAKARNAFAAFDHAAIGMALVALDGGWLQVNGSVCQITGYTEPELLTRTFQDITHPDDLHADLAFVRRMLAGRSALTRWRIATSTKRGMSSGPAVRFAGPRRPWHADVLYFPDTGHQRCGAGQEERESLIRQLRGGWRRSRPSWAVAGVCVVQAGPE